MAPRLGSVVPPRRASLRELGVTSKVAWPLATEMLARDIRDFSSVLTGPVSVPSPNHPVCQVREPSRSAVVPEKFSSNRTLQSTPGGPPTGGRGWMRPCRSPCPSPCPCTCPCPCACPCPCPCRC